MKKEAKENSVLEKIHQHIDDTPASKLSTQDASFVLLERINHKLSRQNELLAELIAKDNSVGEVNPPVKKRFRLFG